MSKPGSPHIHRSKKVVKFLVNVAGRLITNAKPPDQSRYKSEEIKQYDQTSDVYLQEIVKRHRSQLTEALLLDSNDDFAGAFAEKLVEKNIHVYVKYALYLQRQTETLEAQLATVEKPAKLPFQVIPQLRMKVRAVTFGKEQITEMVTALASDTSIFEGQPVANHVADLFRDVSVPSVIEKRTVDLERRRGSLLALEEQHVAALEELEKRRKDEEKKITPKQEAAAVKRNAGRAEKITKERAKFTKCLSDQDKRLSKQTELKRSSKKRKRESIGSPRSRQGTQDLFWRHLESHVGHRL